MASKEEKRRIVEGYATSGMTRREYCAKQGIAVRTLDYWRLKRKAKLVEVAMNRNRSGRDLHSRWRTGGASKARGGSRKPICCG
jgi:hypothetical protein